MIQIAGTAWALCVVGAWSAVGVSLLLLWRTMRRLYRMPLAAAQLAAAWFPFVFSYLVVDGQHIYRTPISTREEVERGGAVRRRYATVHSDGITCETWIDQSQEPNWPKEPMEFVIGRRLPLCNSGSRPALSISAITIFALLEAGIVALALRAKLPRLK